MPSITVLSLPLLSSNVFALRGERTILIDTGNPGSGPAIITWLAQHGIGAQDLALIVLTHGHLDHWGSAKALRDQFGVPIAIHRADAVWLRRGHNPRDMRPTGLQGALLLPFILQRVPACEPDVLIDGPLSLHGYGVDAQILLTPGHSAGSISVLTADGACVVGDLLAGGMLYGRIAPGMPSMPYFSSDRGLLQQSIAHVLDHNPHTLYVGHGGPLAVTAVRRKHEQWKKKKSA